MSGRLKYGLVEEIASEIGYTAMNSLIDWFGGSRLFIPKELPETHPITQIIGQAAAARLVKWMDRHERLGTFQTGDKGSKRRVWLGMNIQRENDRRDRMIVAMLKRGWPMDDVLKVSGMSQAHVYALRQRAERMGMLPLILGEPVFNPEIQAIENSGKSSRENPPPKPGMQKLPGKPAQEKPGRKPGGHAANSEPAKKKPAARGRRPAWD